MIQRAPAIKREYSYVVPRIASTSTLPVASRWYGLTDERVVHIQFGRQKLAIEIDSSNHRQLEILSPTLGTE